MSTGRSQSNALSTGPGERPRVPGVGDSIAAPTAAYERIAQFDVAQLTIALATQEAYTAADAGGWLALDGSDIHRCAQGASRVRLEPWPRIPACGVEGLIRLGCRPLRGVAARQPLSPPRTALARVLLVGMRTSKPASRRGVFDLQDESNRWNRSATLVRGVFGDPQVDSRVNRVDDRDRGRGSNSFVSVSTGTTTARPFQA
jgi:hypothetical protein